MHSWSAKHSCAPQSRASNWLACSPECVAPKQQSSTNALRQRKLRLLPALALCDNRRNFSIREVKLGLACGSNQKLTTKEIFLMQKKVIALAVAALASSAAFAQTNVTIYGVVDVQQAWVKSSGAVDGNNQKTVCRLDSHGNYIGFKGVEDLGNGLKAVFQYETEFYADAGGGLTGNRDSFVGLTGGFGTVVAGRLTHPLRAMGAKVDLLPGAAGFGTTASLTGQIAGVKTN